jgi:serine/threonine-protein kinase
VCRALDRAHRRGIVHLDLRPSAIMFSENQRVVVSDLGIAAPSAEVAWSVPSAVSPERARYASPEQADGQPFDEKTDVYALALILVESVTGSVPFVTDSVVATLSSRIDRLFPVSADLGALASVLEKAGRAQPEDRSSAAEMGRALVQSAPSMPRPEPLPLVVSDATGEILVPSLEIDPTIDVARPSEFASMQTSETPAPSSTVSRDIPTAVGDLVIKSDTEMLAPVDMVESDDVDDKPVVARWIIAATAALVLVVGGFFAYRWITDNGREIPILANLTEGQATNSITEYGWDIERVEEFSEDIEAGRVIRTEPAAGDSLKSSGVLTLVVSSGPPPVPLPDLANLDSVAAVTALGNVGLQANVLEEPSEEVPVGVVVRWVVPAQPNLAVGDDVIKGTTIDVYVSQGPAPRIVPDLKGQTLESASAKLAELRLTIKRLDDQFFVDVPAGAIGSQVPAAGEQVERDSEISVVVSKGPDVVAVPVLRRLNFEQVKQALADAGLVVGNVTGNTNGVLVALAYNGQIVTPGQLLPRGAPVDLAYFGR